MGHGQSLEPLREKYSLFSGIIIFHIKALSRLKFVCSEQLKKYMKTSAKSMSRKCLQFTKDIKTSDIVGG